MDGSRRANAGRAHALAREVVVEAGVPRYHDYRQQPDDRTDAMRIKRGAPAQAPVGAGKGFKGF